MAACSMCGIIGTVEELENHECFDREETNSRWKAEASRLAKKARKLEKDGYPCNAARLEGMAAAYRKCARELVKL